MKNRALTSLFALAIGAAAAPGLGQESAAPGGFRLPTATPTPTDVQGPVDPDAPILTRPRAPTPTPTPRATAAPTPTPTPVATPTPRAVLPPRNSSLPPRFTPPAAPTALESEAVVDGATPFPSTAAPAPGLDLPLPSVEPSTPTVAETPAASEDGLPGWLYALGGLLVAGAIGGAYVVLRRRREGAIDEAPVIERPPLGASPAAASPAAASPPAAAIQAGPPLVIEAHVQQLARSMMFATLTYELRVTNRGPVPLENVSFGGDLVTAHARVPTEQQIADPAMPLTPVQSLTRLDPGESASFAGEFRLPVNEIRPIPHGKAVVYVPLLRVRADADGMDPIARTFIVGLKTPGSGQRLQPFRLDEMPQTYHAVGQKALD